MWLLALLFLLPFAWMISTSLKPDAEAFAVPMQWIPEDFRWGNYTEVLFGEGSILPAFGNSVFVALLRVFGELATATLAGYAFAKLRFRGRNVVFLVYLATSLIPAQLLLVPRFVYFQQLGLYDSLWALILPGMFTVLGTFLMRQFFVSQPGEFAEAARIDGANELQIFWRIYLPNALPMISALAILTFVWSWNDYETPLVFLSTPGDVHAAACADELHRRDRGDGPGDLDGRRGHLDHPDPRGVPDLPAPLRAGHDRERPEVTPTDLSAHATTSRRTPPMPSLATVSGVAPSLAQIGDFGPPRSELGVGALMPYNGALYVQNYNSHRAETGTGVSLRRIEGDFSMEKVPEAARRGRHLHQPLRALRDRAAGDRPARDRAGPHRAHGRRARPAPSVRHGPPPHPARRPTCTC